MIPGIILLGITAVAVIAGGSLTSVLGTQALAMLIWTGALGTAIRKKWPTGGVGETVTSHKWCGNATVFLMVLHIIAAIVSDPAKSRYFFPFDAPPPGAAGIGAALMGLTAFGLGYYRKHVKMLPGPRWKLFHGLTAVLAALLGITHVIWLNNLVYDPLWQSAFALLFVGSVILVAVRLRE